MEAERGKLKDELDEMQTEHASQLKEVREEHDKKMQKIAADVANRCVATTTDVIELISRLKIFLVPTVIIIVYTYAGSTFIDLEMTSGFVVK